MYARKLLRTVAALIVAFAFACGLIPNSLSTKSPTPTELSQFDSIFPPDAPTPISTVLPSLPPLTFSDMKVTNSDGKVVFEDNISSVNLNVQVWDTNTNSPIEGIQIQVLSDGNEFLIIALDPNREYLPSVESVRVTSSRENDTYKGFSVYPVYAQGELAIALRLVRWVDWVQTGKSAIDFFTNFPEIKKYSLWYGDLCFTGEQLANYFSYNFGVATALVPIPNADTEAEKQILEAIFKSANQLAGSDADLYLRSLPDTYLIRVHGLRKPKLADANTTVLSLVGFEYLGLCKSAPVPTETANIYQLPRSLSTIPILSDGTVDLNATLVLASISELSKIYLDVPYAEKIEATGSSGELEIDISSIERQTKPYVLDVNSPQ